MGVGGRNHEAPAPLAIGYRVSAMHQFYALAADSF